MDKKVFQSLLPIIMTKATLLNNNNNYQNTNKFYKIEAVETINITIKTRDDILSAPWLAVDVILRDYKRFYLPGSGVQWCTAMLPAFAAETFFVTK